MQSAQHWGGSAGRKKRFIKLKVFIYTYKMWIKYGRRKAGTAQHKKWESECSSGTIQAGDPKADFWECSELGRLGFALCSDSSCVYRYINCHCSWTPNTWNRTSATCCWRANVSNIEVDRPGTASTATSWALVTSVTAAVRDVCSELPAPSGSWGWAALYSPLRDQETLSGSICTKIANILT